MLYDVVPPTVFLASLGGIVVILSRVMMRVRRETVTASVDTARTVSKPARTLLKPNQNGVQASGSRWRLFTTGVKETVGQANDGVQSVRSRWQEKRNEAQHHKQAAAAEKVIQPPKTSSVRETVEGATQQLKKLSQRTAHAGQQGAGRLRGGLSAWRKRRTEKREAVESTSLPSDEHELRSEVAEPAEASQSTPSPALHVAVGKTKEAGIRTRVVTSDEAEVSEPSRKKTAHRKRKAKREQTPLAEIRDAIETENYQRAEDLLIEHISDHTKDVTAYLLLGKVCLEREEWHEAMEVFERVTELKPSSAEAYTGLGNAALKAGKYTQALLALQRAHDADPMNREILEHLLVIARRMDNPALQSSISRKIAELARA